MQVNMILLWSHSSPFTDFHCHCARHHIAGCQILGRRCISLHESLTFTISQDSTLSTTSFRHETTSSINPGRMKLHEFIVLIGDSLSHCHGIPISSTCVSRCAAEICTSISSSGQDSVFGMDSMNCSIFHIQGHDSNTRSFLVHHEIHGKVFNKVSRIKGQRSPVQGV